MNGPILPPEPSTGPEEEPPASELISSIEPDSEASSGSPEPSAESPEEEEPCDELSIEVLSDFTSPSDVKQTCAVEVNT